MLPKELNEHADALEARTPFLSVELARFVERLPASPLFNAASGKVILREIAYRYLPRELIDLPKRVSAYL